MLVVLNRDFGGFEIPEEVHDDVYDENELKMRSHPKFIDWVKKHPESDLEVVELPNGFTDYYIDEYDGLENLIYVLDGKLYWAEEIEDDE